MTGRTTVEVKILPHGRGLDLPAYATRDSAGADLRAAIEDTYVISPGNRRLVPTGICIALPPGFEIQIRPRSGLAFKNGISCLNAPGTIDADYRGELGVILINHGKEDFTLKRGMRIAQMVLAPVYQIGWREVDGLSHTDRGAGGFGSTGAGGAKCD